MSIRTTVLALPPITRYLVLGTLALSVCLFALRLALKPHELAGVLGATTDDTLALPWIVLVPGHVFYYPWTLVISSFVESNLIELIVSLFTLALAGRYLERVWGSQELLRFTLVVVVVSNIIAVIVNWAESFVFTDPMHVLYGMQYHGLMALQTGFLVAFTQLIPEHQVQLFGGLASVRVKNLPMAYVTVSNVLVLIGWQSPWILIQFGWLVSWFYLRFFKLYTETMPPSLVGGSAAPSGQTVGGSSGGTRGDRSETFSFASWFPPLAHPIVVPLSNLAFNLAVQARVIRPWHGISNDIETGMTAMGGAASPYSSGARAEAERRRALALKALDQRMATSGGSAAARNSTGSDGPSKSPVVEQRAQSPARAPSPSLAPAPAQPAPAAPSAAAPATAEKSDRVD